MKKASKGSDKDSDDNIQDSDTTDDEKDQFVEAAAVNVSEMEAAKPQY